MMASALAISSVLRRATPADALQVVEGINLVCAEGTYFHTPHYIPTSQWEAALHRLATVPDHLLLIAESEGQFVGCVSLFPCNAGTLSEERAELGIFVLPPFRNQGVGSAMMDYVLEWAAQQRYREILLTVHHTNRRGIHLYQKSGFSIQGEYQDPDEAGWRDQGWLWMRCLLPEGRNEER